MCNTIYLWPSILFCFVHPRAFLRSFNGCIPYCLETTWILLNFNSRSLLLNLQPFICCSVEHQFFSSFQCLQNHDLNSHFFPFCCFFSLFASYGFVVMIMAAIFGGWTKAPKFKRACNLCQSLTQVATHHGNKNTE